VQRGQDTGIDLVGLEVRLRDRLHMQRIGHDDASHIGAENADYRHRVAGGLEDDLIALGQTAVKALERRAGHVDPTVPPQPPVFPEHHLGERPMDVHTDHAPHPIPSRFSAKGATGCTRTTDPRSRRIRAGRRGGRLLIFPTMIPDNQATYLTGCGRK